MTILFIRDWPTWVPDLRDAGAHGSLWDLEFAAHTPRSTVLNFVERVLRRLALRLEQCST
jgi:hypothetical protein